MDWGKMSSDVSHTISPWVVQGRCPAHDLQYCRHIAELVMQCRNCHTKRRSIKARGLCSMCYNWQRRIEDCDAKLELLRSHPGMQGTFRPGSLFFKRHVAKRVLEELRWREEGLLAGAVDSRRLEAVVCALARDCRSEVAGNTSFLIGQMSPKSRRLMS